MNILSLLQRRYEYSQLITAGLGYTKEVIKDHE